ncbi:MAG: FHA domain-containing protein [Planctomycetota bacterium]
MAYLTIRIKGEDGYTQVPVPSDSVILGRSSSNDIQLAAEAVSRQHCKLYRGDEGWMVEDMGSSNGTRVDNHVIDGPTAVDERSVIKCGHARLTFHRGEVPTRRNQEDPTQRVPVRTQGVDDPPEAFPCEDCAAWLSCAHRLPGDSMACPRCGSKQMVPNIKPPEMAAHPD